MEVAVHPLPRLVELLAGRTFPMVPCHLRTSASNRSPLSSSIQGISNLPLVHLVPTVQGTGQAHPTPLGRHHRLYESLQFVTRPTTMAHWTQWHLKRSPGICHYETGDTATVVPLLTRKPAHQLGLVAVIHLDGRSSSCGRTRAKDRAETVCQWGGPPVTMLARRRGHSSSCVDRILTRTVAHHSGMYTTFFLLSYLTSSTPLSHSLLSFPLYHHNILGHLLIITPSRQHSLAPPCISRFPCYMISTLLYLRSHGHCILFSCASDSTSAVYIIGERRTAINHAG